MARQILFLCTGNYYRSRFAEEIFNHFGRQAALEWAAVSMGLALEAGSNVGPISVHTRLALEARGIPLADPIRYPQQVSEADLRSADMIIALKEVEHRRYLDRKFPGWSDRVLYWHVHDLDKSTADEALPQIETHVRELIKQLKPHSTSHV